MTGREPVRLPSLSEAIDAYLIDTHRARVRAVLARRYGADMATDAMVAAVLTGPPALAGWPESEQDPWPAAEWALFDQVRALKVHDDAHACWVPPVIGWWDQTGRTHCLACPLAEGGPPTDEIVADNSAAIGCRCDFCGAGILAAALTTFGSPA